MSSGDTLVIKYRDHVQAAECVGDHVSPGALLLRSGSRVAGQTGTPLALVIYRVSTHGDLTDIPDRFWIPNRDGGKPHKSDTGFNSIFSGPAAIIGDA